MIYWYMIKCKFSKGYGYGTVQSKLQARDKDGRASPSTRPVTIQELGPALDFGENDKFLYFLLSFLLVTNAIQSSAVTMKKDTAGENF